MMREVDTEPAVVWPEWCYNTTGESRSSVSPSSSADQKGCGLAMSHNGMATNGRKSAASPQSQSAGAAVGPLVNALSSGYQQHDLGLSFITSTMALSANKLFKLAQQHQQQQQNYRPPPINPTQGTKRKHLDSAVALLNERLSPATNEKSFNNNSQSVNNLNLEKLAHRLNGGQPALADESGYLTKSLTAKDVDNRRSPAAPQPLTLKSERISPISFNGGKMPAEGRSATANMARSRSSTPSSSSSAAVFNSPSNIANKNGTLGLNSNGSSSNGTGQRSSSSSSSSNNGPNELSLSRLNHRHHLSTHKYHQGGILTENLQQSQERPVEPPSRNYSDMIRNLAAKYNTPNENNGHFISPSAVGGGVGQQAQMYAGSNNVNSRLIKDRDLEPPTTLKNNNNHNGLMNAKRCRSPAIPGYTNSKVLANNPSLVASLAGNHQNGSTPERSSPGVAAAQPTSLISSFLTGLPSSIFTPLIDMTSTQALVSLARAAKEAEFLNLLKTSSSSTAVASSTATAASSVSSSSASLTNGGAVASRKRLQTTRSVLNATNQNIHLRSNSSLFNGFGSAPNMPPSLPHLNAAAGVSAGKGSTATVSPTPIPDLSLVVSTPLDLSSGQAQAQETDYKSATKRIKIEPHLSPSFSPGPDSGIGEMITMMGGRELTSGTSSSDSESPGRRSVEESQSPRRTAMEKWPTTCNHQADIDEMNSWTVEQVCEFVATIDICAEYAQNFREQTIDGTGLPLLTEEHLRNLLSMKLGPALKLKAILSSKMGSNCQKCSNQALPAQCVSPALGILGADLHLNRTGALNGGRISQSPPVANESFKGESSSPDLLTSIKGGFGEPLSDGMGARVAMGADQSFDRLSTMTPTTHDDHQIESNKDIKPSKSILSASSGEQL